MLKNYTPGVEQSTPVENDYAPGQGGRGTDTQNNHDFIEFPSDARGRPILDAAGLEVLKAWRYFNAIPGDLPAIVAALLVIAWAIKARLS